MSLSDLGSPSDVASAVASAASVGIAYWAIKYARQEISLNKMATEQARKASREAEALHAYSLYLERCIEYPQYSSWDMYNKYCDIGNSERVDRRLTKDSESYLWFLSTLVTVCDQILVDVPEAKGWEPILKAQLRYHEPVVKQLWDSWEGAYHEKTRKLVKSIIDET